MASPEMNVLWKINDRLEEIEHLLKKIEEQQRRADKQVQDWVRAAGEYSQRAEKAEGELAKLKQGEGSR